MSYQESLEKAYSKLESTIRAKKAELAKDEETLVSLSKLLGARPSSPAKQVKTETVPARRRRRKLAVGATSQAIDRSIVQAVINGHRTSSQIIAKLDMADHSQAIKARITKLVHTGYLVNSGIRGIASPGYTVTASGHKFAT